MPSGYDRIKFLTTLDGNNINLEALFDAFKRDGKVYHLYSRNKVMEDIIKHNGKIIFEHGLEKHISIGSFPTQSNERPLTPKDYQMRLINMLGKVDNAIDDFYPRCEIKNKSRLTDRENEFLGGIQSYLKKKYRFTLNDIYFTSHEELEGTDKSHSIITRDTGGRKIQGKNSGWVSEAKYIFFGYNSYKMDVALNVDNLHIQQLITLFHQTKNKKPVYELFADLLKFKSYAFGR